MTASTLVFTGAMHWDWPDWRGRFYPDDLPEDWLLSYYNTQFQAVYLPAAAWQAASGATWERWLGDTLDGFHFVLEPGEAGLAPPDSSRVRLATPEWVAAHVWWLDEAPDLRALAQRITRHATSGEPLFVFSRSGNLAQLARVKDLKQVMGY